jgi:hypothetical protein
MTDMSPGKVCCRDGYDLRLLALRLRLLVR